MSHARLLREIAKSLGPDCNGPCDACDDATKRWTEALLAGADALEAAEWRPIETAPEDRMILLADDQNACLGIWVDTSHTEERLVSERGNRKTYETVSVKEGYFDRFPVDPWVNATHWRPRPDPPGKRP